jgi:antitoxin FitA
MASITISGLDEAVEEKLRVRAARRGRSVEDEAREILEIEVASNEQPGNLGDSIRALFEPLGGFELPEYPGRKAPPQEPPSFG